MKLTAARKLVLASIATTLALQAGLGLSLLVQEEQTLLKQLDKHAEAVVAVLAADVGSVTTDAAQKARHLGQAIAEHEGVVFCEIKDGHRNTVFRAGDARADEVRQYTFATSLSEPPAASSDKPTAPDTTVTLSFSLDDVRRALARTRATVATGAIAGAAVTWLLAALLVRDLFRQPLRRLLKKARAARVLSLTLDRHLCDGDELGQLEETLEALGAQVRRLAERETKLTAHALSGHIEHQQVAELKRAYRALEQVNRELDDFAYIVSHDLKAPLRHIKALVEWITADCSAGLPVDQTANIRLLVAQVDRMQNLINGILQYSRMVRGQEERVTLDTADAVVEAIELAAPPDNIHIEVCDGLPTLTLQRTKLVQVFQNLLSNAIKFMDKPTGRITIACQEEVEHWTFRVADNGPGIDKKHHEEIFRMFHTLCRSEDYESTGIGLTLVKRIIETYGGRIWVESLPGEGSTFFFTLPKNPKEIYHEKLPASTAC